jgi:FKBP12-rapamycin complex-associated protein
MTRWLLYRVHQVLRRMLSTRSIILRPSEDLSAWLHLANVCRRSGALTLCGNVLQTAGAVLPSFATTGESAVVCLSDDDDETARGEADHDRRMPPLLRYAVYKLLWAATHKAYALERMLDLSQDLETRRGVLCTSGAGAPAGPEDEGQAEEEEALLGKVYVRIGEWQMGLNEDNLERPVMEEVMGYLQVSFALSKKSKWPGSYPVLMPFNIGGCLS